MVSKLVVAVVVVVLLLILLLAVGPQLLRQELVITEEQAREFALQELNYTYPGSSVQIYDVRNESGTWRIRAKVIYGRGTPCPNLTLVELNFPKTGFVPREPNVITSDCHVLGCKDNPSCLIANEEEAVTIVIERNAVPELDRELISKYGFSTIRASALFYPLYADPVTNTTYSDVWVTTWSSTNASANVTYIVILNKTGGSPMAWHAVPA